MNNLGIDEKRALERAKYWEEIVKINPYDDVDEEEEWTAYEEFAKEVEENKIEEKVDFVNKIKEIREKHKLLIGGLE